MTPLPDHAMLLLHENVDGARFGAQFAVFNEPI